ncbi:hypothetical protein HK104_001071 [Borealophlyctis nickersoniae]|nr:hypothetical protein HK104_001071 [Borealophlyctis nickersoniae]
MHDEPVAWGQHLQLGEKEENEIWRMGLGNLKALHASIQFRRGGIMLQKLTMGLGPKLESLHLAPGAEYREQDFAELLRNLSENCPYLVDFYLFDWNMKDTNSLHRFVKTQQQLVYLNLRINLSDELIRTVAASCPTSRNWAILTCSQDVIEFLRQRGKDIIRLEFPNENDCSFAKLNEFLPNIRSLGTSQSRSSFRERDVIAFLEAEKLEDLWMSD